MGLPTFQSVVTCVPNRYCLMSSGLISASHTLDTGELRKIVALAMKPLFVIASGLQRVQDRTQRRRTLDLELDLSADARQRPQMMREHDTDHSSVWTSTDST